MFEIGWSELLIIGVVALIAIGPKELPGALRTLGQWMGRVRRMANDFQDQFRDAMREAEVADLKKQVDEMTEKAKGYAEFDPLNDIKKDFESFDSGKSTVADNSHVAPTIAAADEAPASAQDIPPAASGQALNDMQPAPQEHPDLPPATAAAAQAPIKPAPSTPKSTGTGA